MDEMREGLRAFREGLRKVMETVMGEEKNVITLKDVLELIRVNSLPSPVQVVGPDAAALTGSAKAALWAAFANQRVRTMRAERDRIVIQLEDETHDDET